MPSPKNHWNFGTALLACGLALAASGCQKRTVQAAPPVVIAPAPTETQPPPTPAPEIKPEPQPETPPPAPPVAPPVNPTPKPAPHKTPATPKENSEPAPAKPAAPQISPQLTPADQVAYQQKTDEDIAAAEKNLQKAYGRELTAAQHDLVEKIRGFIGQAREAAREQDWVRAHNLAQKANVLSVELANSL
jgi:outer membrane biosynthesis protein TonB